MTEPFDTGRLDSAEEILGWHFGDRDLLAQALTHPSFELQGDHAPHYERLEFLGDAVLGLIVVEEAYRRFPELPEGTMTKIKIAVVAGSTLTTVGEELGLGSLLRVGDSERGTGRRGMASALENVVEALIGALYLDGGLDAARSFVLSVLGDRIRPESADDLEHPKSRLQEYAQSRGQAPTYEIVAVEGAPHDRCFSARVLIDGRVLGTGSGRSKKEAEMLAAAEALDVLDAE